MARTQRVPATRRQPPVITAGDARGLSGYRYLLAVVMLVALSSGSVLALVGAGVSSLGHWPVALPGPLAPAEPAQTSASGADPFVTYQPPPPPPARPQAAVRSPCRASVVWQIVG